MPIRFDFSEEIERKLFKQIDFALVRTYTKAAYAAQQAIRESLPQRFTLRNNFVLNSIRVQAATKADPTAAVYVPTEGPYNANFLIRQELGGIKTPKGNYLAIPVNVKRSRANKKGVGGGIIGKNERPRALLQAGQYKSSRRSLNRVFLITDTEPKENRYRHNLVPGIYASHPNRASHKKGSRGLTLLYVLEPAGRIGARFKFRETGIKAAQRALPGLFAEALSDALRTVR